MCSGKVSFPVEKEGETSQQRTVMTPSPNSDCTVAQSATPSSGVMLLFTPKHSQADTTTRTCEETVRCDPLPFKNTFASCFFFPRRCYTSACGSDECEKPQIHTRASLQFSLSHQDKLCSLQTIFCQLALIPGGDVYIFDGSFK